MTGTPCDLKTKLVYRVERCGLDFLFETSTSCKVQGDGAGGSAAPRPSGKEHRLGGPNEGPAGDRDPGAGSGGCAGLLAFHR